MLRRAGRLERGRGSLKGTNVVHGKRKDNTRTDTTLGKREGSLEVTSATLGKIKGSLDVRRVVLREERKILRSSSSGLALVKRKGLRR